MKGLAFYEAAAQVIPVLFLVLVFEMRYLQRASASWERIMAAVVIFHVALGEFSQAGSSVASRVAIWRGFRGMFAVRSKSRPLPGKEAR